MLGNIFKVLISVKAKLFFGFLSMAVIILALGGYALLSTTHAGAVVKTTFDKPLMAINYARSAGQVFAELEIEILKNAASLSSDENKAVDIAPLLERFKDDLSVTKNRSIAPKAAPFFESLEADIYLWESGIFSRPLSQLKTPAGNDPDAIGDIENRIRNSLDIIIELQTNESFRQREKAIANMRQIKTYSLFALIAAVALTIILSVWIAVTIINPLKAAANAAQKISAGNFNVDIPPGGDDETGVLLKTMSAMQTNIRSRMGQEQNLRALAQHRLSDSLKNSRDAILLTDSHGHIIVSNPQVGQMFPALNGADVLQQPYLNYFDTAGKPLKDPCLFHPEHQEIHFVNGRWSRINASDTQEGGRLFIWSDITDEKQKTQNLLEARDAAQAADKAKTLFLAAMSHELRTPLNAVIGFSDILEDYNKTEDGVAEHAELAGLISQSGAHLLNIVKDVLSIASGDDPEGLQMDMGDVDIIGVINFCVTTITSEAQARDIKLLWQPETIKPLQVQGDKLRLQQLMLNLLSNAIKFNKPEGVVQVDVSAYGQTHIRIDVRDSGIGIAPEDIKRITEPFIQVDEGFTRKHDGVGLGLSLVQKILSRHDGQLHIHSALGQGTAVTIILPKQLTQLQSSSVIN